MKRVNQNSEIILMKIRYSILTLICTLFFTFNVNAQKTDNRADNSTWVPDIGNGQYKNPIIYADYSDPDVCRVGSDYYLVASSFDAIPGLPILHSKDLVNWTIIGHALKRQPPYKYFSKPRHGQGVWAPAIRHHKGMFYIYFPDPDFGIYMVKAKNPAGPWTKPVLVMKGKGLEDPCPLWDSDGNAYLIHAFAGSRAGIKSILILNRMNESGTKVVDNGIIVYDGHKMDRDVEGPKLYKRHGYYYIFAPAGGVSHGWQIVLRSKNIYGPYIRNKVLEQGQTDINGPHQGAWVTTSKGASWFIHFQDRGVYGRVTLLEPMKWVNDWPVIGKEQKNGTGEPVHKYKRPDVGKTYPVAIPQTSDEFNGDKLGLQWQWQANPKQNWYYPDPGKGILRLYCTHLPEFFKNYWDVPNILLQKFPAPAFTGTTKFSFHAHETGDKTGLIVMGKSYAFLALTKKNDGNYLQYEICKHADKQNRDKIIYQTKIPDDSVYFRVNVQKGGICHFSYSIDGNVFHALQQSFQSAGGKWIGAKVGLFSSTTRRSHDSGYTDFDWFRITKNSQN